jgi:hypothetical protein
VGAELSDEQLEAAARARASGGTAARERASVHAEPVLLSSASCRNDR